MENVQFIERNDGSIVIYFPDCDIAFRWTFEDFN